MSIAARVPLLNALLTLPLESKPERSRLERQRAVPVARVWNVCNNFFSRSPPPSGRLGSVLCGFPPIAPAGPHKLLLNIYFYCV